MDALRIKERGSKDTPTNFSEQAVNFMKGMPGYYPQNHYEWHKSYAYKKSSVEEGDRPAEEDLQDKDILNRQETVLDDGTKVIEGQVAVENKRTEETGTYEQIYGQFETNADGLKVNPRTGATYGSIEEFIEDAKTSDKKEGIGTTMHDVKREIKPGENWSSSFWGNFFDPKDYIRRRNNNEIIIETTDYKGDPLQRAGKMSKATDLVFNMINGRDINGKKVDKTKVRNPEAWGLHFTASDGKKKSRLVEMRKFLEARGYENIRGIGAFKIAFEDLLFKDPDAAEQLYMELELNTGGGGRQRDYNKQGSDTNYRYTD